MSPDQILSDKEFEELDQFLLSDRCGDEAMTMDALHGYLTAIAAGPEAVGIDEWLPLVWGPDPEDAPVFSSAAEAARVSGLIERVLKEINARIERTRQQQGSDHGSHSGNRIAGV